MIDWRKHYFLRDDAERWEDTKDHLAAAGIWLVGGIILWLIFA